jgi:outer membrane receptor protein involved in Fe transport
MAKQGARANVRPRRIAAVTAEALLCYMALYESANAQGAANSSQGTVAAHAASLLDTDSLEEILVTATKRKESLQKIPISVTAISGRDLQDRNVVNFDDYARSVPGVSFTDLGDGRERIAIRGVDSKIGQSVVGYYFGETPIPDSSSVSAEKVAFDPEIVDINRVEVLRGPQGTVFGSGSMGGTIRVIPNEPDSTKEELSIKNILSSTEHANGPAELVSGMLNIPLVKDTLALRMSTWASWDSGFIQRQVATPDSLAANRATGARLVFRPAASVPAGEMFGGRVALRFQASESLDLETSLYSDQQCEMPTRKRSLKLSSLSLRPLLNGNSATRRRPALLPSLDGFYRAIEEARVHDSSLKEFSRHAPQSPQPDGATEAIPMDQPISELNELLATMSPVHNPRCYVSRRTQNTARTPTVYWRSITLPYVLENA